MLRVSLLLLLAPVAASAGPVEWLPGRDGWTFSQAVDVSADGSVVLGFGTGGGADAPVVWRGDQAPAPLPFDSAFTGLDAYALSPEGDKAVGVGSTTEGLIPLLWTDLGLAPDELTEPALPDDGRQFIVPLAAEVASDASLVVGAYPVGDHTLSVWTPAGGWEPIGPAGASGFGYDVSATGVVVGQAGADSFRWSEEDGFQVFDAPTSGGENFGVWAISNNGRYAVGNASTGAGLEVWLWEAGGDVRLLSELGSGSEAIDFAPTAVSDTGRVVGLTLGRAVVWDAASGLRFLDDAVELEVGDTLQVANAISADGKTVVGVGTRNGQAQAFRVTLLIPEPAAAVLAALLLAAAPRRRPNY